MTTSATASAVCPGCFSPAGESGPGRSGSRNCPGCGLTYDAVLFPLPEPSAGPAASITGDGTSPCAVHAGNAADVSCERCGRLMCTLCRVDSDGKVLCTKCFERLAAEGALPSTVNKMISHLAKARQYTAVSWLLYPFSMVLGPGAFYLCIRAWVERRRSGDKEGRVLIPVLAVLSLLSSAMGFFFVWAVVVQR